MYSVFVPLRMSCVYSPGFAGSSAQRTPNSGSDFMEEFGLQLEVLETMYIKRKREAGRGKKEEEGQNAKRRCQAGGRLEMVIACS